MQFLKVALLGSVFSLILSVPALATKNFAQSSHFAQIEPTSGDEEPRSEPTVKEDKVIIIRNGKPVGVVTNAAPAVAAAPAPVVNECEGGLANPAAAPLPVFYAYTNASKALEPAGVRLTGLDGKISYNGQTYTLTVITFPKGPSRPFSGVEFPMEARFDHVAQDGTRVVVTAPMREGVGNLSFEKILQHGVQTGFDPALLLPANKAYAVMSECLSNGVMTYNIVMTNPVDVSAAQIQRFSAIQ